MKTKAIYPSLVGLLLGLLQTGLFFQLSFTLSSSFGTFLLVTLCWLVGSTIGVFYLARLNLPTLLFLVLAFLAYSLVALLLAAAPFVTTLWPVYGVLILLTGFYPGIFFARYASLYRAQTLFARENNGFIVGMILGTVLFMLVGRIVLYILPFAMVLIVAWFGNQLQLSRDRSHPAADVTV